MSLLNRGASAIDKTLSTTTGKAKSLNPDAVEFVPFALRSSSGNTSAADTSSRCGNYCVSTPEKSILDRSLSSVSNNSDDEAHQFWTTQLPDDITPDFNDVGEEDSQAINSIHFSNLSIADVNETSRFSVPTGVMLMSEKQHELSPSQINGSSFVEKMRYTSAANFQQIASHPWDMNGNQLLSGMIDEPTYNGDPGQGYVDDLLNKQQMEATEVKSLEFLASQFPGFASESLVEVYYANGCDLNLTIEMLTQLELQVDNGLNQNLNSKALSTPALNLNSMALSTPALSPLDFPALSATDNQNNVSTFSVHVQQQSINSYSSLEKELLTFKTSSTAPSLGAIDFASAVRKMASADSSIWKYDKSHSPNSTIGSSRSSHNLASSYGRSSYWDRLANRSSSRSAPIWLETGEAVANLYSEMRGEARDHARLRNLFFEQAHQAYLVGQKALGKELSSKGQLHNMQLKAAHEKAQESIYYQRNQASLNLQGNGRGQERIIDLHGLHVNEAINILKRDLMTTRNIARSTDQRLQVYICVGTGHHTKATRTPARLPVAVQRYLLDEGFDYSEPQQGLLRVVLY